MDYLYHVVRERRRDLEREAQRQRLIKQARQAAAYRPLTGVVLAWTGRRMISLGQSLAAQADAMLADAPTTIKTGVA